MMAIEIRDHDIQGILTVDLTKILNLLAPEGKILYWSILDLEATGFLANGTNILELEQKISQSTKGVAIDWGDLVSLAQSFDQVVNATIVGYNDVNSAPTLGPNTQMLESCEIVIEAIDSSLWMVSAHNEQLIKRLGTAFENTCISAVSEQ